MSGKLNCRPGDLAYIVAPYVEQGRGHFVTVERAARTFECFGDTHFQGGQPGAAWVCSGSVPNEDGRIYARLVIADGCLRPVRDQPGDDETPAWAGKPLVLEPPKNQEKSFEINGYPPVRKVAA